MAKILWLVFAIIVYFIYMSFEPLVDVFGGSITRVLFDLAFIAAMIFAVYNLFKRK